jgi:hypothetical protein
MKIPRQQKITVFVKKLEGRHERSQNAMKLDGQHKKNASTTNGSDSQIPSTSTQGKGSGVAHSAEEPQKLLSGEGVKHHSHDKMFQDGFGITTNKYRWKNLSKVSYFI